jgi:hypothetical protein
MKIKLLKKLMKKEETVIIPRKINKIIQKESKTQMAAHIYFRIIGKKWREI